MERFILLIRIALSEQEMQLLAKTLREKLHTMECIDCTLVGVCSVKEKSQCPIQIYAENINYMKANAYRAIKNRIDYILMLPQVTFLCLVDTEKHIGYIYKGKEDLAYIEKHVLPSTIDMYQIADNSFLGEFILRDMRQTIGVISPLLN